MMQSVQTNRSVPSGSDTDRAHVCLRVYSCIAATFVFRTRARLPITLDACCAQVQITIPNPPSPDHYRHLFSRIRVYCSRYPRLRNVAWRRRSGSLNGTKATKGKSDYNKKIVVSTTRRELRANQGVRVFSIALICWETPGFFFFSEGKGIKF